MTVEQVAEICHEANRIVCVNQGDVSQVSWSEAPDWQKESCIGGVRFHREHPQAGPRGSHENWMAAKAKDGWVYGPLKDADAKTHPCMVDYDELPEEQRLKDYLFVGIVHALKDSIVD